MNGVTVTSLDNTSPAAPDIARCGAEAVGTGHLVPLLDAVVSGVRLVFIWQRAGDFALPRGPWIALVGDDPLPQEPALGPDAFPHQSIRDLMHEAHAALVVAAPPLKSLYSAAALPSVAGGKNVIIVETRSEQEGPWCRLCRRHVAGPLMVGTVDTEPA